MRVARFAEPCVISRLAAGVLTALAVFLCAPAAQADITRFLGSYSGSAEIVVAEGDPQQRDMSVQISETGKGFTVQWTTTTYRPDGSAKPPKSYSIDFLPSDRAGVYAAAMRKNVFGHSVQLDPMKGEPYVWARIAGDTLTVYSLFVDAEGGYELQQFDRTLAEGGLQLDFKNLRNGDKQRSVSTFLKKE